jgi:hypothetical protein
MFAVGCSTSGSQFRKRSDKVESFVFRTMGEPGQHFTARLNLDGVEREVSGVSPAEFPLEACVLSGVVKKTKGEGTLGFRVVSEEATLTFGKLVEPGSARRFRYHARGVEVWD